MASSAGCLLIRNDANFVSIRISEVTMSVHRCQRREGERTQWTSQSVSSQQPEEQERGGHSYRFHRK